MSYENRKILYENLESARKRPVISFITSSRVNASAQMGYDVIPELTKQLNKFSESEKEIDILIVSDGGDPLVSWRFITMLREKFEKIGVLIPFAAYSAATLLALGADEIVMHPFSNLGPVDPQLTRVKNKGQEREEIHFGSEDLKHFLDYIKNDVGLSDQEQLERAFEIVCNEVGTIPIGIAKRSSNLALSMGEKLLMSHMQDKNKAKAIAEKLNTSFYHHGYPLGRKEAEEIGLNLKNGDKNIEDLIWKIWEDFSEEMNINSPFDPLQVIFDDPKAAAMLGPAPVVNIPANLPQALMQQAYNKVLQDITISQVDPVEHTLYQAALESLKCRSEYNTHLKITAIRQPDLKINASIAVVKQGWEFISN